MALEIYHYKAASRSTPKLRRNQTAHAYRSGRASIDSFSSLRPACDSPPSPSTSPASPELELSLSQSPVSLLRILRIGPGSAASPRCADLHSPPPIERGIRNGNGHMNSLFASLSNDLPSLPTWQEFEAPSPDDDARSTRFRTGTSTLITFPDDEGRQGEIVRSVVGDSPERSQGSRGQGPEKDRVRGLMLGPGQVALLRPRAGSASTKSTSAWSSASGSNSDSSGNRLGPAGAADAVLVYDAQAIDITARFADMSQFEEMYEPRLPLPKGRKGSKGDGGIRTRVRRWGGRMKARLGRRKQLTGEDEYEHADEGCNVEIWHQKAG